MTRRSAGPQFANSPRFLLSQSTPQRNSEVDIDDDDEPHSTAPAGVHTPAPSRNAIPPRRQRDVIEDSDEGELFRDIGAKDGDGTELVEDAIDSSLPEHAVSPGDLGADFDAVFAPVRDSHKRRRLSGGRQSLDDKLAQDTPMPQASPGPRQAAPNHLRTPGPRVTPRPVGLDSGIPATPGVLARSSAQVLSTPGNMTTPFRGKPRFVLSAKKPPSSQTPSRAETPFATQSNAPPERRKPTFVLPREPSPDAAAEDIPAPFSPSSRTLRRRGRGRGQVAGYAPGGMAAEVRSWILEMGSKHESVAQSRSPEANTPSSSRYLVTARVVHATQGTFSSSGPVALVQAEITRPSEDQNQEQKEESECLNIMVMGLPRSQTRSSGGSHTDQICNSSIKIGDLVAIHRGLTWEMDLHDFQALGATKDLAFEGDLPSDAKRRWLVAMEWSILPESP